MCCRNDHCCEKVVLVEVQKLPRQPVTIDREPRLGRGGGVPLRQPRRHWLRSRRGTSSS